MSDKKETAAHEFSAALLDDFMKINNELVNLKRELEQRNRLLVTKEKRLRELLAFNPDAQILLTANNRVLFLNPAAKRMFKGDEDRIGDILADLDLEKESEHSIRTGTGQFWIEARGIDIQWEDKDARLVSLRDISARKMAEEEMEKAMKLKGVLEMAGATAHEFSQPLQSLKMDIDFLSTVLESSDRDVQEALNAIQLNTDRLAELVRKAQGITQYKTIKYSEKSTIIDLDKASGQIPKE